jgi:hypothetical protein
VSEQLSPFHAAVTAFEIRFEMELTSRWQKLESAAGLASSYHNPPEKKRTALNGFLEAAENEICCVIHEYFPRLLQVATAQRRHLGNESPLPVKAIDRARQACEWP